jgi:hypothetical protein
LPSKPIKADPELTRQISDYFLKREGKGWDEFSSEFGFAHRFREGG